MFLLIDNYDSFTYNLSQAFMMLGEAITVIRNDQLTVAEIETMNLEGIILSPGPGGPEEAGICIELLKKLGDKTPIFGVCLGHQAIGAAFGAKIGRAQEILHGKERPLFHFHGILFQNIPLPLIAGRYHSLVVEKEGFPNVLQIDAEDAQGNIMALSHREFPIFGVQFHPESIMTPEGQMIIKNFIDFCRTFSQVF